MYKTENDNFKFSVYIKQMSPSQRLKTNVLQSHNSSRERMKYFS